MIIRCISAVIMLAVAFTAITLGSPFFEFFIMVVFFVATIEEGFIQYFNLGAKEAEHMRGRAEVRVTTAKDKAEERQRLRRRLA